tara:strand:- start:7849 stop:9717 length:1869 start_codon:yes stop_codon:yes gene_type:complete
MNILEQEDYIKGAPDEMLVELAQMPTQFPGFLIVSEIQRRQKMRQAYAASQQTPQGTVTDQVVSQAVAEMPPQPMAPPTEMAPPPYETRVVQRGGRRIRKPVRREEQIVGEGIASLNANPDELMNAAMGVPMEEPVRMREGGKTVQELQALVASGQISEIDKARIEELLRIASDKELEQYNLGSNYFTNNALQKDANDMTESQRNDQEIAKLALSDDTKGVREVRQSLNTRNPRFGSKPLDLSFLVGEVGGTGGYRNPYDPDSAGQIYQGEGSSLSLVSKAIADQDQGGQVLGGDVLGLDVKGGRSFDDAKQQSETINQGQGSFEDVLKVIEGQNAARFDPRTSSPLNPQISSPVDNNQDYLNPPPIEVEDTSNTSLTQDAFNKMMTANQALEGAEIDYSAAREALGGDIDFSENQVNLENIIKDYSARAEAAEKEGNKDAVNFAIAQLGAAYASTGNIGDAIGEASKTAMKLKGKSEKRSDALKGLATQAKIQEQVSKATIGMEESKAKRKQAELLANVGLKEQESIYNLAKLGSDSAINTFKAIELAEYRDRALKAQMDRDQVMRLESAIDLIQAELNTSKAMIMSLDERRDFIDNRLASLFKREEFKSLADKSEKMLSQ